MVLINGVTVLRRVGWVPKAPAAAAAALEFANGRPLKEPFMSHWENEDYSYLSRKKDHFCIN